MRRGLYFSLDALLAVTLMGAAFSFVLVSTGAPTDPGSVLSYQQADTLAENSQQILARSTLAQVLSPGRRQQLINDTSLTEEDINSSVLEAVAVLWASNETAAARDLVTEVIGPQIGDRYEYRVRVLNDGSSTIYTTAPFNDPSLVARASRLVSGVARNQPTTGFIAKASLSSVGAVRSAYYYFGGYEGDGTLTANMTLPDYRTIESVGLELSADGNFSLEVNNVSAGAYNVSDQEFRADTFTVCNETYHSSRCGALERGYNMFEFSFPGNGSAISGGFIRVQYNETESLDVGSGKYQARTRTFTGVRGLINLFGSMYAPGTLQGISGMLHYDANATMLLRLGNTTLYANTTEGEQRVTLTNETIVSRLNANNVTLAGLSNRTVPLRLGITNISELRGQEVDAVSVIDVSGSMDTGTRLEEAKNASKEFVDIITNITGNRAGMVAYESVIRKYHALTTNGESVKDRIDTLMADGGTCIGCGILNATSVVTQSGFERLVPRRAEWEWSAATPDGTPPDQNSTNWTEVGYDTSAWNRSQAILGLGDPDIDTALPDNGGDYFLRKEFEYDPDDHDDVKLFIRSRVNAAVYLNGHLIDNDTSVHDGRYWNRESGGFVPEGAAQDLTYSFEDGMSGDWAVEQGSLGNEVAVSDACGATDGVNATVMRWNDGVLRFNRSLPDDEAITTVSLDAHQGGDSGSCENPEAEDDVFVEYRTEDGEWSRLGLFDGGGSSPTEGSWAHFEMAVPEDAVRPGLTVRLRYNGGSGSDYDYWAFDNITVSTERGETITAVNRSWLNDGNNVVAAELRPGGLQDNQWVTETTEDWEAGTGTNVSYTGGRLGLQPASFSDGFGDGSLTGWSTVDHDATAGTRIEETGGLLEIEANGKDIWNNADEYAAAYREDISGDWNASVQVVSQESTSNWAKTGVFSKNDASTALGPAGYAAMVVTPGNGYSLQWDSDGDGDMDSSATAGSSTYPSRVRLERSGSTVRGYYSTDGGDTWTLVGSATPGGMSGTKDIGIIATSHSSGTLGLNQYDDFRLIRDTYAATGNYTSELADAGTEANWTGAEVTMTEPNSTSTNISYTDGSDWYSSVDAVPDGRYLGFNVSMSTTDPAVTPTIDTVNVTYRSRAGEFDLAVNATEHRNRSIIVMSDGEATEATEMSDVPDHDGDGDTADDPQDHTIESACRAYQREDVTVYAVGFGSDVDNETLNQTAQCGNGQYYFASTGDLTDIFTRISESILEAARSGQRLEATSGSAEINGTLFPDSYLHLNYSSPQGLEFGKVAITQQSDRFGGGVTSPKNGSFRVPEGTELLDARLLSYSSRYWIDFVRMQHAGRWESVYDLPTYGTAFEDLGDPFQVHLPPALATVGAQNNVSLDTASNTSSQVGGSPDSRVVYDLLVNGSVGYGVVFNESEGGTTTVRSEYDDFNLSVGNASAAWNPQEDALDNATARLLDQLDVDGDGDVDFQIDASNLNIDEGALSGIRWLWGPARLVIEVWQP